MCNISIWKKAVSDAKSRQLMIFLDKVDTTSQISEKSFFLEPKRDMAFFQETKMCDSGQNFLKLLMS